jgi:16S rRNA (cytosine967-C5)-methyltransferase
LQLDMLRNAAANILPQGTLLYSTCSTEPEENEHVVKAFLEEHPDYKLMKLQAFNSRCPFIGGDGFFRSYPNHSEEDGFFAALLVNCESKAACAAC